MNHITLLLIAVATGFGATYIAAGTFPGADAAPCDPTQFVDKGGYWNNPTCVYDDQGLTISDLAVEKAKNPPISE